VSIVLKTNNRERELLADEIGQGEGNVRNTKKLERNERIGRNKKFTSKGVGGRNEWGRQHT